jgi:RNA polymerase sigma factor (sigma-70 family)
MAGFNVELFRQYKAALEAGEARKAARLMNQLVIENMPLVKKFTRRTMGVRASNEANFEEACNEGAMGLVKAIEKFDEAKGSFSTFAAFQIRHAVQTCIAKQGDFVKLRTNCMPAPVAKAAAKFRVLNGREPERDELTHNGGEISEKLWDTWHEQTYVYSLETAKALRGGADHAGFSEDLEEVLADETQDADTTAARAHLRDKVTDLMAEMSPRNRDMTQALFIDGRSCEDVGEAFGLCKQRVHQIKKELGERLRGALTK